MNRDEIMDEELTSMVSYTDETVPAEMPRMEPDRPKVECKHEHREGPGEAKDASESTVRDQKTSFPERLLGCMKWIGICGCISMLMWWFWVNNLMATEAAYITIWLSSIIGAAGAGRSSK